MGFNDVLPAQVVGIFANIVDQTLLEYDTTKGLGLRSQVMSLFRVSRTT